MTLCNCFLQFNSIKNVYRWPTSWNYTNKREAGCAEANKWKLIDNRSLPKVNNNKVYFC